MKFVVCLSFAATALGRTILGGMFDSKKDAVRSDASNIENKDKGVFDFKMNPSNGLISMEEWLDQASQKSIISDMTYFKDDFFHPKDPSSICEYVVRVEKQKGVQYSVRELAVIPMYFWTGLSDFSKFKYNSQHAFCFPESCIRITDSKKEHEVVLKIADQVPLVSQIGVHSDYEASFGLGAAEWSFCNCEGQTLGKMASLKETVAAIKPIIRIQAPDESSEEFSDYIEIHSFDSNSGSEEDILVEMASEYSDE